MLVAVPLASAQGFRFIEVFGGNGTGANPQWSPTIDQFGNLYVTVFEGGNGDCTEGVTCGIVFKGTLRNGSWIWNVLYGFNNEQNGANPSGPVTLDAGGSVYGAAGTNTAGVVYELRPAATRPATAIAPWSETVLFRFSDPGEATPGPIALDSVANIYGVTVLNFGTVYELTRTLSGYTETTLYSFQGGGDGVNPYYGLSIDSSGNLYGVTAGETFVRGVQCGTAWELTHNGSGWTKTTLYGFQGLRDGCFPNGPLARDSAGNLFGTAVSPSGSGAPSVLYELSPGNGSWTFSVLLSFADGSGSYPGGSLAVDDAGNVYGVVNGGGVNGGGNLFELSPSGDSWTYTDLFDFTPMQNPGSNGVSRDSHGNFFGTTQVGGPPNEYCSSGCGTVWEFTP